MSPVPEVRVVKVTAPAARLSRSMLPAPVESAATALAVRSRAPASAPMPAAALRSIVSATMSAAASSLSTSMSPALVTVTVLPTASRRPMVTSPAAVVSSSRLSAASAPPAAACVTVSAAPAFRTVIEPSSVVTVFAARLLAPVCSNRMVPVPAAVRLVTVVAAVAALSRSMLPVVALSALMDGALSSSGLLLPMPVVASRSTTPAAMSVMPSLPKAASLMAPFRASSVTVPVPALMRPT